ncbi:hypothetical protein [Bdellovibrio sp. HCB337]|uniref:hypothetical protein n=1 Tax=Bdellovibrio sp. HCB337 TaxID=3394358 RepID=UPI0039A4BD01
MENFFKSLPKPVLAILVILAVLIFFMFNDPPHTVCQVQADNLKESMKGQLFSTVINKNNYPPIIARAQEACQLGNSSGSCLEYFGILRKAAREIKGYSSDCRGDLINIPEVRKGFTDGVILLAKMAWGSRAPEPGMARFGWLQESELGLFCLIKDVYSQGLGDEAWNGLRASIFQELPGELRAGSLGSSQVGQEPPKAMLTMEEKDIWARSLFSVRCENYR